ncbi:hypothetical protein CDL15_Pgr026964 [Punica granatum]|uniref:Protein LNK3 n=1 Tax=Punica granatum TaxID=22663 RepID=A0A218XZT5_PUNGR|nr:hypothetical protein CDL15_Pgr026964 [Punica granatum]
MKDRWVGGAQPHQPPLFLSPSLAVVLLKLHNFAGKPTSKVIIFSFSGFCFACPASSAAARTAIKATSFVLLQSVAPSEGLNELMEGQFVTAIDFPEVHKNVELSDRLPSPNSWAQWGIGGSPETFGLPKRKSVVDSDSASQEFCQGSSGVADSSSAFEELSNQSPWQDAVPDHMDFQLDNLGGVGEADDLFLNSFLEDSPGKEKFHGSFCVCPDCWYEVSLAGNLWLNPCDSHSISSEKQHVKSSNCTESRRFSPSLGWEKDITAPQSVPCKTEKEMDLEPKAPMVNILVPSEHGELHENPVEEMPFEKSVLHDLELLMKQLTKKTRICFRDALYRLADNTKHHPMGMEGQSEELDEEKAPPWTEDNQDMRSEKRMLESETNIIDRAVANIMFHRMDFSNQDFAVKHPYSHEQEMLGEGDIFQCQSLETSMFPHDHEVPVFTQNHPKERSSQLA